MLTDDLGKYNLVLASRSPRRRELLRELGVKFEVRVRDWNEVYPCELRGEKIALYVAEEKATSFLPGLKEYEIVITADTIVWCNGRVLDKPIDEDDAFRILRIIAGKTHEVITGVCILSSVKRKSFFSSTRVTFSDLTDEEIMYYIRNYQPYDKAGAYGIQEWIGLAACSRIEGSYFNVMGLPIEQLYHELQEFIKDNSPFEGSPAGADL